MPEPASSAPTPGPARLTPRPHAVRHPATPDATPATTVIATVLAALTRTGVEPIALHVSETGGRVRCGCVEVQLRCVDDLHAVARTLAVAHPPTTQRQPDLGMTITRAYTTVGTWTVTVQHVAVSTEITAATPTGVDATAAGPAGPGATLNGPR